VKELKTAKIRLRKSLTTDMGILCFGAICQLFHSSSVTAGNEGRAGTPLPAAARTVRALPTFTDGLPIHCE
jgi:hypothetical protein